jgi:4a-hydroxytetrahydrobiopterin dehydratase
MSLTAKSCVPCRGGVAPLGRADAEHLLAETPGWALTDEATRIERTFRFPDFAAAMAFVVAIGQLAESEGHHPDIAFGWGYARVVFYTHKIKGLHENDFIMAAKVNGLAEGRGTGAT